jgi:hypothetical protein
MDVSESRIAAAAGEDADQVPAASGPERLAWPPDTGGRKATSSPSPRIVLMRA